MLIKPMSYILVIIIAYVFKRVGFLRREDAGAFSKVMINFTLPCAIIQAVDGFARDRSLVIIGMLGLICSVVPLLAMYVLSRKEEKRLRVYRMLNCGGYNIGCFSLPLIEAFFGAAGVATACLFDIGNAIVMTGGAYALTSALLHTGDHKERFSEILRKFLSAAPFDTYLVLLALLAFGIKLPQVVLQLTQPPAQANAFLAMVTIGLMFEPDVSREDLKIVGGELFWRYAFAAVFAALIFFFAPLERVTRMTLAVLCLGPISSLAPVYTGRCGGDVTLASFTNSASIVVSIVVMIGLSTLFTTVFAV